LSNQAHSLCTVGMRRIHWKYSQTDCFQLRNSRGWAINAVSGRFLLTYWFD